MIRQRVIVPLIAVLLLLGLADKELRAETQPAYTRTVLRYTVPDVTLVNQDGVRVGLKKLLLSNKPVLVDFVYTTCTTICPVLSANFTNFQRKLGPDSVKAQLVSISIDPENDTPKAMKAYLKRYNAKPGWDFLTGSKKDIEKVVREFKALDALTLNKMDHYPLILLKSPASDQWVRVFGLIGTTELMKEYERAQQ